MNISDLPLEKEQRILDAAQSRFARYGFSKVTMDEIAEDIGMGKASLYYYYPTKEHIFREVIRREQDVFLAETSVILKKEAGASEKLLAYVRRRTALGKELSNLSALNAKLWQDPKPVFKDLFVAFAREEVRCVKTILSEGRDTGEFTVSSPEQSAQMLVHAIQGLRLRYIRAVQMYGTNEMQFDEFAAETELLVESVLHGMIK